MSDPLLPPELERLIFIHAFRNRVKEPTNLFLVSKRVREWLLPVAFEVVIVRRRRNFPILFSNYDQFVEYGSHIRHLMIQIKSWPDNKNIDLDHSLRLCPNITNLSLLWMSPPLQPKTLSNLSNLTHLTLEVGYLFNLVTSTSYALHPSLFPNITHLDAVGTPVDHIENRIAGLGRHLPNLTHISFLHLEPGVDLLKSLLRNCRKLKALVWWKEGQLGMDESRPPAVDDERIITMSMPSQSSKRWEDRATGKGMGMWEFADEVLKERAARKRRAVCRSLQDGEDEGRNN
ncbi:hypothetical protein BDN72DRAFT_903243 [Pluteus cervinus]|uniref:Uncharacterized protein n=1 Tax=Pluteus cervinus TaxID=181527 RepID=A0ACD3AC52_9AGAR|nr:hypothetical protein BDN72DRAFT_903243 [Pluteus cervinus]